MTVECISKVKSCANDSKAVLTILGNTESGTIGVHTRDDDNDVVLIAISAVDASNLINDIARFLSKAVEE